MTTTDRNDVWTRPGTTCGLDDLAELAVDDRLNVVLRITCWDGHTVTLTVTDLGRLRDRLGEAQRIRDALDS